MCDNQYIRTIGENNFYGILNIFNNIYDRNDCFNVYTVTGNTKINFGGINNCATLYYNKSIFSLLVDNAEIIKYDGTGTTINGDLTVTENITSNNITELKSEIAECDNKYALKSDLSNYALKSEIPEISSDKISLTSYRKIDNLNVYTEAAFSTVTESDGWSYAKLTTHIDLNGCVLIGSYRNVQTSETGDFEIVWNTTSQEGNSYYCDPSVDQKVKFYYYKTTKKIQADSKTNSDDYDYALTLQHIYRPTDELVLKSVYEAKITELEARIAALEAK